MSVSVLLLLLAAEPHRLDSRREAGADSCPDEVQLTRAVAERLGFDPFSSDAVRTVSVRWRSSPEGLSSDVTVLDEHGAKLGSRKLNSSGRDCAELSSSTALALALIIDPMVLTRPAPTAAAVEALPPPPAPPTVVPAPTVERPAAEPVPPVSSSLWLGAGTGLSVNEMPSPTASVEIDLAWHWRWLWAGLKGSVVLPGSTTYAAGSVSGLAVGAGPFACAGTQRFGGCLFTRFGAASWWASDFQGGSTPATTASVAVGLQPYVDFAPLAALRLRLQGSVQVQPTVSVLTVGSAEAWRTPLVAFGLGLSAWYAIVGSGDAGP